MALHRLKLAAAVVARHDMLLAVENHKDWRADELIALLKKAGSDHLGVCLDVGNSISLLEDPMEVVETLAPRAFTTHFKDMAVEEYRDGFLLSEVPLGPGIIDLPRVVQTLRKARPEIRFNIEMITRDPLKVPCLTDRYFATFAELPARHLARTLSMVRSHTPTEPAAPHQLAGSQRANTCGRRECEPLCGVCAGKARSLRLAYIRQLTGSPGRLHSVALVRRPDGFGTPIAVDAAVDPASRAGPPCFRPSLVVAQGPAHCPAARGPGRDIWMGSGARSVHSQSPQQVQDLAQDRAQFLDLLLGGFTAKFHLAAESLEVAAKRLDRGSGRLQFRRFLAEALAKLAQLGFEPGERQSRRSCRPEARACRPGRSISWRSEFPLATVLEAT